MSPLEKIKQQIIESVQAVFPDSTLTAKDIGPTPSADLGDLAVPMFKLAKVAGKAPGLIAEELREKMPKPECVDSVQVAGPYVNVKLNHAYLTKETFAAINKAKSSYGSAKKNKEKVMVEFISPNNNKPLHIGHLRNAVLGESICRLLEASGSTVVRAILINDRGVAIAKAMVAYQKFADGKTPAQEGKKGDHFVGDLYVLFEQKKKQDPSLEEAVYDMLRKWEAGDKATRALWRTLSKWCLDGHAATYKTLGIKFDKKYLESTLYKEGKKYVKDGLDKKLFERDEKGNVVAKLPGLPDKVVLRSDDTAVYITTDLALTVQKMEENKLTRSVWIVGSEQDMHFKQLFGVMRLFGYPWADALEHLSYGMVELPDGRMKSREGNVVETDELVEKVSGLATEAIKERHDFLSQKEIDKRADEIALGAIKYFLLSVSAKSNIIFNPKESLAFTGKTGPYIQYTNARILSILRKAAESKGGAGRINTAHLSEPSEWNLVMKLAQFPDVVAQSAGERDPSVVAKYLYELAKSFSEFYEQVSVLKAEPEVRRARLWLIKAVQLVIARGMELLSMPAPKEM